MQTRGPAKALQRIPEVPYVPVKSSFLNESPLQNNRVAWRWAMRNGIVEFEEKQKKRRAQCICCHFLPRVWTYLCYRFHKRCHWNRHRTAMFSNTTDFTYLLLTPKWSRTKDGGYNSRWHHSTQSSQTWWSLARTSHSSLPLSLLPTPA